MARWRFGRGWTDAELRLELSRLDDLHRNFGDDPGELHRKPGWYTYGSESVLARVAPGPPPPDGAFARGRRSMKAYEFSDRRIVRAFFDMQSDLAGRRMVLELRAFRALRFLTGVVVGAVRERQTEAASTFGYRYDTLEGHIERGSEWFVLTQDHESGALRFRISARWLPGDFPNWWSRIGFRLVRRHYQMKWHRLAHERMAIAVRGDDVTDSREQRAARPDVKFERMTQHA